MLLFGVTGRFTGSIMMHCVNFLWVFWPEELTCFLRDAPSVEILYQLFAVINELWAFNNKVQNVCLPLPPCTIVSNCL